MTRLTHWNYKNTTLDLESCKPYLKLGEIEDLEDKFNVDVNEELFKKAKAFDIINEKRVDINLLHWAYPNCKAYNVAIKELNNTLFSKELTSEEFEFLGRLAGAK